MATAVIDSEAAPRRRWLRLPERLPELGGRWLTAYSLLWTALLAIALVGSIGGAYRLAARGADGAYTWAAFGLDVTGTVPSTRYPRAGVVRNAGSGAEAANIRVGDVIVAVEGHALPRESGDLSSEGAEIDDALGRVPEGGAVSLLIRGSGGKVRAATLIKRRSNAEEIYAGTGITPAVHARLSGLADLTVPLILIAAACVLFGKRKDPVATLLALALVCLACTSGAENLVWVPLIGAPAYLLFFKCINAIGGTAMSTSLLTFPRGKFEPRWTGALAIVLPVFYIVAQVPSGPSGPSSFLAWIGRAIIVAALLSMAVRYRRAHQEERQQWRWALLGFVAGIGILISWSFAYPAYVATHTALGTELWAWIVVPTSTAFCISLMVGGVTLSVLRYRLYDTSAAVSRSAAYGVLTLGFVALFAGAEKLAEIIGETYFEHSIGIVAGAVGAAVAAAVVVPLHNRVHRWAERRFQKPLIRLREGLPECVSDLRDTASIGQIAEAVMKRVEAGVRSTREALLLAHDAEPELAGARNVAPDIVEQFRSGWRPPSGEQPLDCDRHDPLFPLRVRLCIETRGDPETIGWLLLGPRPDGSFFGRDEREAIAHVAGPVARAIHIAQIRERREEQAEMRLSSLETLIAKFLNGANEGPGGASFAVS